MELAANRRVVKFIHTVLDDFFTREENKDCSASVFIVIFVVQNTVNGIVNLVKDLIAAAVCCSSRAARNRIINQCNRISHSINRNNWRIIKILAENLCVHCGRAYDNTEVAALTQYAFYKAEYKVNIEASFVGFVYHKHAVLT